MRKSTTVHPNTLVSFEFCLGWGLRVVDDWMIRILRLYRLIGKSMSNRLPTKSSANNLRNGSTEDARHLTIESSKYELCSMNS